jgi:hypothetical protein
MKELTDLEICKRIAEIEGEEHYISENKKYCMARDELSTYVIRSVEYNPLTDDALCFRLMVKYSVRVETENCSAWTDNDDGYPQYEIIHCKGTVNKAICLAIIASEVEV